MVQQVKFATVPVRDQQRALGFYLNKLGFEVRRNDEMGPERWIEVAPPGGSTSLVLYTPPGFESRIGTATGIVFECVDLAGTYEDWRARGVDFLEKPTRQPWGLWAQFRDSEGNVFGLVSTA